MTILKYMFLKHEISKSHERSNLESKFYEIQIHRSEKRYPIKFNLCKPCFVIFYLNFAVKNDRSLEIRSLKNPDQRERSKKCLAFVSAVEAMNDRNYNIAIS